MNKRNYILLIVCVFSLSGHAQTFNTSKLDSLFDILDKKSKAMGSLSISKNGVEIYSKSIGYSDVVTQKRATAKTEYRIGSITKMFTSVMIFQLIEEDKITLNTTLSNYFPNLPNAKLITIGNLLNHRSGIHNFTADSDYPLWMTNPKTHEDILAVISKSKPDFQPNEKSAYSNSNYVILGYIIEKVTKKSYAKCLNDRILSKINLKNTYCGDKINLDKNECYSYVFTDKWDKQPETDLSIPGGAGSVVSTSPDLTKFIEALFLGKLISTNSLNQMKTISDGMGMGIFQYPFYNKVGFGHNGSIDGFASSLCYFPQDSLAVSYCSNGVVYPINDVLIGVLSCYFNKAYNIPDFKNIVLRPEDLDQYLGVYSSKQLNMKIDITKDKLTLYAQATGQKAFPLEATEKDKFKFEPAGVQIEFNENKTELTLKQGGGVFKFQKDK